MTSERDSLFPDGLFDPREMERDEFYGEYIVIPKSSDEDGDEIVLFGATIEEAREIVAAVNESRLRAKCYCGYLDWTVATYGRLSHKHGCPARRDSWCQSHPEGCPT